MTEQLDRPSCSMKAENLWRVTGVDVRSRMPAIWADWPKPRRPRNSLCIPFPFCPRCPFRASFFFNHSTGETLRGGRLLPCLIGFSVERGEEKTLSGELIITTQILSTMLRPWVLPCKTECMLLGCRVFRGAEVAVAPDTSGRFGVRTVRERRRHETVLAVCDCISAWVCAKCAA